MTSPNGLLERETALARLSDADRSLLTPDVLARWESELGPDDLTDDVLRDIARRERRRIKSLETIRDAGDDLSPKAWQMVLFLRRHEGRVCSYATIAHHLFGSKDKPITERSRRVGPGGYAVWWIVEVWKLAGEIRHKLEIDPGRPQHLATRRGAGYSWHDLPPSKEDGVDYRELFAESERLRLHMRYELGLDIPDDALGFVERRQQLGPEHPSHVDAEITHRESTRDDGR